MGSCCGEQFGSFFKGSHEAWRFHSRAVLKKWPGNSSVMEHLPGMCEALDSISRSKENTRHSNTCTQTCTAAPITLGKRGKPHKYALPSEQIGVTWYVYTAGYCGFIRGSARSSTWLNFESGRTEAQRLGVI
jgi:hypothetical protein